jgi:hypothetical protein
MAIIKPETKNKVAKFLTNEYQRLSSRKFQVWCVSSVFYAFALAVYLRSITMAIWKYYEKIDVSIAATAAATTPGAVVQQVVEATGSLTIFTDFMKMLTWYYGFICLLYCATNLVDKVVAWKFGPDAAPATPPHEAQQP